MKKLFLLLSLCCMSFAAWADEYTDENGVTWTYQFSDQYWDEATQTYKYNNVQVFGCSGYGTEVVVPQTIAVEGESYNVTSIGNGGQVFYHSEGGSNPNVITSVALPATIREIGWHAFAGLTSLKNINLPEGLNSLHGYAFSGCSSLVLTLPVSLSYVGEYAFQNCNTVCLQFTDPAALGNNVASSKAFYEVKHIAVPDNAYQTYKNSSIWKSYSANICTLAEVVEYTHEDDYGVTWTYCYVAPTSSVRILHAQGYDTNLKFPATLPYKQQQLPVTAIECSFENNADLAAVDLSETSITATPSFSQCPTLSSVKLPATLKEISAGSFYNCDNLQTMNFSDLVALEKIGSFAFNDCDRLQNVDFSASRVKTIESQAFNSNDKLSSVLFPATLETIADHAFSYCAQLNSVDLSATKLTSIASHAFCDCRLNTVVLPASLKKIDTGAFASNYSSLTINLSEVEEIGNEAFNCTYIYSADLSSTKNIGVNAFAYCDATFTIDATTPATIKANSFTENTKFVVTPNAYDTFCNASIWRNWADNISMYNVDENGVKWIYRYLKNSNSMCITSASDYGKQVVVPSSVSYNGANVPVTHIENAFNGAEITSVTLPATLTDIADFAFASTKLTAITVPASVKNIGSYAFAYNQSLASVSLPASLVSLKNDAFRNCDKLNKVDLSQTKINAVSAGLFKDCYCLEEVVLPATLTDIADYAFESTKLTAITVPASVKNIGSYAFRNCDKLNKVDLSQTKINVVSAGLFKDCDYLEEVVLPATVNEVEDYAFNQCHNLSKINLPASLSKIGSYAFYGCHRLKSVDLSKVETIGNNAFYGINLTSADLSSATSIGSNAFYYTSESGMSEPFFKVDNTTPATLASGAFPSNSMFLVPGSAVTTYKTANVWSDYASRIFASNVAVQTINVTAQANGSGVLEAIGGSANQTNIIDLTVKGTINGYDFVMFKDKMLNLRFLDLSEATVVYNPYRYYEYNYSQNDTLGAYAFNQENKLVSIKLPKGIKHIGSNAFSGCTSLSEVVFGDKLESIGSEAFASCNSLSEINLPNTITRIEYYTFGDCHNLKEFTFPNKLEYIGGYAFCGTGLKEVVFPTTLKTIEYGAFQSSSVETVRIPSSLEYVREGAFQWCYNLKHVYTCTIEPTDINENTFSTFETANLYVPKASGQNYYWDEGWKRFLNIWEFDEEYLYFYLNGDHTLDESTGAVDGTPEADLNPGSGLIVEEEVEQNMSDLHIHQNGNCSGSIIAGSTEGNISTENLHIHINVESGRWYFFCFPFNLNKENISFDKESTQYVFRSYDGSKRAEGNSGWKNVTEENGKYLKAAEGYIFQCSQSDVLTISLAGVKFKKENKYNELVAHVAANMQDASWNFVGNPYLSYYDMADLGYDAPITVWNGYTYEAINPGDDDYQLAPFEAFFVQKPEGTSAIAYSGDDQTTYQGSQAKAEAARARRRTQAINPERLLVNITISNGEKTDRTRIVFNNNVSMGYELACDAAKFEATGVPQLYTIDSRAVKYAINERPVAEGIVTLGYSVPTQGSYTLAAPRMDTSIYIKDNLTGTIHDFSEGSYEFASEAGVFENRFTVIMKAGETGIDKLETTDNGQQSTVIYDAVGRRVEKMEQGIYIKENRKVVIK